MFQDWKAGAQARSNSKSGGEPVSAPASAAGDCEALFLSTLPLSELYATARTDFFAVAR